MYASLTGKIDKFSKKHIDKGHKDFKEEMGDMCENEFQFTDEGATVTIEDIDGNKLHVLAKTEFGEIWITAELDDEDIASMIEHIVKRLNKFKSVMESLK